RTLGGRYALRGDLDSETGERLVIALSPLSAPRPEPDGTRDRRSAARRRADGLAEFLRRHARCNGSIGDDEMRTAGPPVRRAGRTAGPGGAGRCGQPPADAHDLGGGIGTGAALSLHIRLRDLADADDDVATRSALIKQGRFAEVFDNLPHGMTD